MDASNDILFMNEYLYENDLLTNFARLQAQSGQRKAMVVVGVAFVLVEGVLPWFHEGSTPGGGFVRMSCETRERTGARRAVFYAVRLAVLAGAFVYFPFAWPVLGLFYLVARRMPYDFL